MVRVATRRRRRRWWRKGAGVTAVPKRASRNVSQPREGKTKLPADSPLDVITGPVTSKLSSRRPMPMETEEEARADRPTRRPRGFAEEGLTSPPIDAGDPASLAIETINEVHRDALCCLGGLRFDHGKIL